MSIIKKKKKTTFHLPSLSASFKTSGQIIVDNILNQTTKPTTLNNQIISRNNTFLEEYNQLPVINTEIELIHNLSLNEDPEENILNSSIRYIKEKEKIDNDIEINLKRLGKQTEEKKNLSKDEIKANQSREFFIKYEIMKNEKIMDEEISKLKKSLEEVRNQKENLNIKIILLLKEIYNNEVDIRFLNSDDFFLQIQRNNFNNLKFDDNKSTISVKTHKTSRKIKKREEDLDSFYLKTLQLKEQTLRNNKKQEKENELNEKLNELKFLKTQYDTLKDEYKLRKKKLEDKIKFASDYYHKKLYEGLDIRNEGLIWIIKAIWNLGENITMSFFPNFLDQYSIDYLFNAAHKSYDISIIKNEINKLRKELDSQFESINKHNNNNKNLFRTSINHKNYSKLLTKHKLDNFEKMKKEFGQNYTLKSMIKYFKERKDPYRKILDNPSIQLISDLATQSSLIEYELLKLKRVELDRLFKEFFENKYGEKYNVNLETVVGALVGENKRDNEMFRYYKMKKEYFDNMRYIQYFSLSNERSLQIKENKDNMKNNNIGNSN